MDLQKMKETVVKALKDFVKRIKTTNPIVVIIFIVYFFIMNKVFEDEQLLFYISLFVGVFAYKGFLYLNKKD